MLNLLLALVLLCGLLSPSILPSFPEHQSLSPGIQETQIVAESAETPAASDMLLKLPMTFIENQGQLDSRVKYYARLSGQTVYFTDEGITFDLVRYPQLSDDSRETASTQPTGERLVFSIEFANANCSPVIEGTAEAPGKVNYLIGNDPAEWHTDIPTYHEVVYRDIYPGIDLRFYGQGGMLEYDLVVNPGATVDDITLAYSGVEGLTLDNGDLLAQTPMGEIRQSAPAISQLIDNEEVSVDGGFKLDGSRYGFYVASYNKSLPLIIDPVLAYSSYFGGSGGDRAWGMASLGYDAYIVGQTGSASDFPLANSYNGTYSGGVDAFVAKIDTSQSGSASLIYSTYLGGSAEDKAWDVDVDVYSGCAYVIGDTTSSDFPTTANGYDRTHNATINPYDVFVTELSEAGNSLEYSTYYGGTNSEFGEAISVRSTWAFITGATGSGHYTGDPTSFPLYNNLAGHDQIRGMMDAFVARFDTEKSGASSLGFSSYLGGDGVDWGFGITTTSGNYPYVTGETAGSGFPTTTGAFQTSYGGGMYDAFVTKFNALPSAGIIYSTYVGGSGVDTGQDIAMGGYNGNFAHITGYTDSSDFPDLNAYQSSLGGSNDDVFLTRLSQSGDNITYSTYLGSDWSEKGYGVACDGDYAFVTGQSSYSFPTKNDFITSGGGQFDAFVAKFHTTQSGEDSLIYSCNFGSDGADEGHGIACASSDTVYIAGWTDGGTTTPFPTTGNAYQTSYQGGAYDAFVIMVGDPDIDVDPTTWDFGTILVGQSSSPKSITVSNTGSTNLNIGTITKGGANPGQFSKPSDNCSGQSVAPGGSRTFEVVFSPTEVGAKSATFSIPSDDPDENPVVVSVSGTGQGVPDINISPASYDYGNVLIGGTKLQLFTVSNTGTGDLVVADNITILGTNPGDFTIQNNNVGGQTIPAGQNRTLEVVFSPLATGARSATLNIWSDDPDEDPKTAALDGNGLDALLSLAKYADTAVSKVGDTINYTVVVTNTGALTLERDSATDSLKGILTSSFPATLNSGVSANVTYDYTVPGGASDPLVNTITAHYHPTGYASVDVSASANCTVDLVYPGISVSKGGPIISKPGDTVTYWAAVTNTGDCTLVKDSVSDNVVAGIDGLFAATLASGVTDNQTYTHLVQAGDPDPLSNLVTVHYHPQGLPNDITDNVTHTVDLVHPSISLSKTADNTISKVGDTINYTCTITNTSPDVALVRDSASDSLAGVITDSFPATLAAGASANVTYTYTVGSGDPDPLPNTITVHYHPLGLTNDITDNATCTVDLRHPDILVTKGVAAGAYRVGDIITYLVSINNTSTDITLVKDSVTDSVAGDLTSLFSDNITAGGSDNQTYTYTVKATDPDPLVNDVTAHYHPEGLPNDITDSTYANVFLAPTITSVTPNQGNQGQTLDIVIAGSQLNRVNAVDFGAGITANSITVDGPTQITVNISISTNAALGSRDVTVTNPTGTDTLAGGFTVQQSQAAMPSGPAGRRVSPPTSMSPGMSGPSRIQLQYLSVRPQQTVAGQPVTITTNVVNTGYEAGSYNVILTINGQVEESRMVSVGAQGTQPVKFTVTKAQPGTYTINIGDQKSSFVVAGAGSSPRAGLGEGILLVAATAVIAILVVLLVIVTRRRFQGY